MLKACRDKIQDKRWTRKDKLIQMRGIVELNERDKNWNNVRLDALKSYYWSEIGELKESEKEFLATIGSSDGIKREMLKLLHSDPELERICSNLSPQEMIETLEQIVFCKRKESDRIKYEIKKAEQELHDLLATIEYMKSTRKKSDQAAITKVNQIANQIERVNLQKEAAQIVKGSYEKMKKVLEKDSRCFDAILTGLKIDTVLQCQCVIQAMELGQRAMEEKEVLSKQYEEEVHQMNKMISEHEATVDEAQQKFKNTKRACSNMIQTDSFMSTLKLDFSSEYEDIKSLTKQKTQLEKTLEKLMEATLASSFDDIYPKCEAMLKDKYRLLRQLELETIQRDTELKKLNHLEALYDTVIYTATTTSRQDLEEKQKLQEQIQIENDLYEKYKKQFDIDSAYVAKIRRALIHFNQLLSRVSLDGPEEIKRNPNQTNDFFHDITKNEPDEEDFIKVSQLFDVITMKIGIMMKQCSLSELTEEEMKEAELLYAEIIQKEVGLLKEPSIKPRPHITCGGSEIPDRKTVKKNSLRLVQKLQAKPPPPHPRDKVVKHEC